MGDINVDYLKPGMVLSNDIKDSYGRFLIGRGTTLEDKHLRIMKMWGITSANIEGLDQKQMVHEKLLLIAPELLHKIETYINSFFSITESIIDDHVALREIKKLSVLRVAQQIESNSLSLSDLEEKGEKKRIFLEPHISPQEKIISAQALVDQSVQLYSFPDIYYQIAKIINDSRGSTVHLAEVVSNDPGLSAIILKTINSAFYGLSAKICPANG